MNPSPLQLVPGTLDLLILRTLLYRAQHGHAIAKHIQHTSEELTVETGSLYPALHRLEAQGLLKATWQLSEKGKRAKYYKLTAAGRRYLTAQSSRWERMTQAISRVLRPAE